MSMTIFKKLLPVLIILILLIVVKNNLTYILNFVNHGSALEKLQENLNEEKKKNEYLKTRLSIVKNDEFVKDEAQNKLGMLKSGEFFVIAPTVAPPDTRTFDFDDKPNWQKWFQLFF